MRILITGSNGQVGRSLVKELEQHPNIDFIAMTREQLDITNQDSVNSIVVQYKPDLIVNSAAYTSVDKAENESDICYAINKDGPKFLSQIADVIGASIIHISTDYVFDGNKACSYVESDETAPKSVYGKSKLAGEIEVMKACSRHIILRTAWVFSEHGNNFVKTMLRLAKSRDSISVVADQFGGPTYAGDIAKAIVTIAQALASKNDQAYGVYHLSGLPHVSWFEFATKIFEKATMLGILKHNVVVNRLSTAEYPTLAIRPPNSRLETGKIEEYFEIYASDWISELNNLEKYEI